MKNNIRKFAQGLWKDESGQGMAEYVLLIVVVVAVATIFKGKIVSMVKDKMGEVNTDFQGFKPTE